MTKCGPVVGLDVRELAARHFGGAALRDARRGRRLVAAAERVLAHPAGTLPQKLGGRAELAGLYRLVEDEHVTHAAVLAPHQARVREAIAAHGGVTLLIHDGTELDVSRVEALAGELGQVGQGFGRGYVCQALVPGVGGTCFCLPRFIQSGPTLGFRWTSTSSKWTATSPGPTPATARRIAAERPFSRSAAHGHPTVGLGRPSRAPIDFRARLIVPGWTRVPVRSAITSTSSSWVHVGRGKPVVGRLGVDHLVQGREERFVQLDPPVLAAVVQAGHAVVNLPAVS